MFMMFMGTFPDSPLTLPSKLFLVITALTGLTCVFELVAECWLARRLRLCCCAPGCPCACCRLIYIPTGIFASGFLDIINERKAAMQARSQSQAAAAVAAGLDYGSTASTPQGLRADGYAPVEGGPKPDGPEGGAAGGAGGEGEEFARTAGLGDGSEPEVRTELPRDMSSFSTLAGAAHGGASIAISAGSQPGALAASRGPIEVSCPHCGTHFVTQS